MTKGRFLSLVVAIGYMSVAFFGGGWEFVWRTVIFLTLPLACIWFGDKVGSYTGRGIGVGPGAITGTSPGCEWLLLLMPVILALVMTLTQRGT